MHWLRAKQQILDCYFKNEAKELRKVVDKIFRAKHGGTSDKDMDEFYSVANEVFTDVLGRYDPTKGDFGGLLYGSLEKAIIDEIKRQNRNKRMQKIKIWETDTNGNKIEKIVSVPNKSLDTPLGETEDDGFLGDYIPADEKYEVENIVSRKLDGFRDERIEDYLAGLTTIQRQILFMKMNKVPISIIQERLGLSSALYNKNCEEIKSFKNISVLFGKEDVKENKEEEVMQTTTMENCKTDKILVGSIIKKIDNRLLRFDHPLQRESDQWTPSMKGNLISDILQGNRLHPLIFAEQIIKGVPIIWDLDGKQRCTNVYSYVKGNFQITKNIRRWEITYQCMEKDENGRQVVDEDGVPVVVNKTFDIRGKRFSQLPTELQDKILDYSFNYDQYLNCTDEDIAYHIERYNDGKPMSTPQKGITKIGTEYAGMVKSIANMAFFRELGGYKVSEFKSGKIDRVVVDSVMAANFMDQWKKMDDNCKYLKDHATVEQFEQFEDMVGRLEKVVEAGSEASNMFDSTNSFLWFGLFAKFIKTGKDDIKFVEFMTEFAQSLHSKAIEGQSFDDLKKISSTKDKGIVQKRLKFLEQLMMDYLGIEIQDNVDPLTFIKENVNPDVIEDDVKEYQEDLNTLTLDVDNSTKLLDEQNRLSLLAIIAYSYMIDKPIDHWFVDWFSSNNTYDMNQKENYYTMKRSFDVAVVA